MLLLRDSMSGGWSETSLPKPSMALEGKKHALASMSVRLGALKAAGSNGGGDDVGWRLVDVDSGIILHDLGTELSDGGVVVPLATRGIGRGITITNQSHRL